jgi:NAD-dependent dihydropyrimidine dehydrogenase PreA subunit
MGFFVGKLSPEGYKQALVHRLLKPTISGNTINGLGEKNRRCPTPVYWHNPSKTPYGWLNLLIEIRAWFRAWFKWSLWTVGFENMKLQRRRLSPVTGNKAADSPDHWTALVKSFALDHEADQVGIAPLDPEWVFQGYEVKATWAIAIGVTMNHERLATAPELDSVVEVFTQYNRGGRAALALAAWIRGQGYQADAHSGPKAGPVNMIPAALACGLGELGKHGSMINRHVGASFRLASVLTDLPLVADSPDEFGADEFCRTCKLCMKKCPMGAISGEKQLVRGEIKWYVDFDKCIPYFNDTFGCAICIAVCPWSSPGIAPGLARKMLRRRSQ